MKRRVLPILGLVILISIVAYIVNQQIRADDGDSTQPVEDLGPIVYSSHSGRKAFYRHKETGQPHLLMMYDPDYARRKYRIIDINLTDSTVRSASGSLGRTSTQGVVYHSNGKIYLTSSSPNYLIEYDPTAGTTNEIRQLADTTGYIMVEGDDHALYIGGAVGGILERYDPATGQYDNYGKAEGTETTRWIYYLGADSRYMYAAVGQSQWYMVVYDRQTSRQTVLWKELNPKRVTVFRGADGLYGQRLNNDRTSTYFKLSDGVATELPAGTRIPPVSPSPNDSYCDSVADTCMKRFIDELDLSRALPDSTSPGEPSALYRWRNKNEPAWMVANAGIPVENQKIQQLYSSPDGKLIGVTGFYGPIFRYDISNHAKTILGSTFRSIYDAVAMLDKRKIFFTGYPSSIISYDFGKEWNLTVEDSPLGGKANPRQLKPYGKYVYFGARGSDGLLYTAIQHDRDSFGSELAWYDPKTEATDSVRAPLVDYNVRDLKPILGGNKLVFVGKPRVVSETSGMTLFVFNVLTKAITKTIVPVFDDVNITKIMESPSEPGYIFGLTEKYIYKVNTTTGELVYNLKLAGTPFVGLDVYTARLVAGPDGWAWLSIRPTGSTQDFITKINPADGEVQQVRAVEGLANMIFQYNPIYAAYDLYLYGGSTKGTTLRLIRKMLNGEPRANVQLSVTAKDGTTAKETIYTVKAINNGSKAATSIRVTHPIPAGSTFVSASDGGIPIGDEVVWHVSSLGASEGKQLALTVRASAE